MKKTKGYYKQELEAHENHINNLHKEYFLIPRYIVEILMRVLDPLSRELIKREIKELK